MRCPIIPLEPISMIFFMAWSFVQPPRRSSIYDSGNVESVYLRELQIMLECRRRTAARGLPGAKPNKKREPAARELRGNPPPPPRRSPKHRCQTAARSPSNAVRCARDDSIPPEPISAPCCGRKQMREPAPPPPYH